MGEDGSDQWDIEVDLESNRRSRQCGRGGGDEKRKQLREGFEGKIGHR
jgi:hypothetical protein